MKTTSSTLRPASGSLNQRFGRRAVAILACMPMALAVPAAQAAAPDGVYKVTRVSGSFTVDGDVVEIPEGILEDAFAQNGRITIRNSRVSLFRQRWADVLEEFNYLGLDGELTTSGPSSLLLKPSGKSFVGRTAKPVRLSLEGSFFGTDLTLNMKLNFRAKVTGKTLTITAPVTLSAFGLVDAEGKVTLVAKK
jgi:hypothetical protein